MAGSRNASWICLPFPNQTAVIPELTFTGGSALLGIGPYNEVNRNFAVFDHLSWI